MKKLLKLGGAIVCLFLACTVISAIGRVSEIREEANKTPAQKQAEREQTAADNAERKERAKASVDAIEILVKAGVITNVDNLKKGEVRANTFRWSKLSRDAKANILQLVSQVGAEFGAMGAKVYAHGSDEVLAKRGLMGDKIYK